MRSAVYFCRTFISNIDILTVTFILGNNRTNAISEFYFVSFVIFLDLMRYRSFLLTYVYIEKTNAEEITATISIDTIKVFKKKFTCKNSPKRDFT